MILTDLRTGNIVQVLVLFINFYPALRFFNPKILQSPEEIPFQKQHHLWEAPQGRPLQEGAGGVRPDQGPGDLARGRPDRNRGEGDKPLGRAETEDQRRTV